MGMLFAINCYICTRKPKRKRALLGSNPPAIGFCATLSVHAGLTTVGFAFFSSDCAPWLRKPYVGAGLVSQGLRQHLFWGPDCLWATSGVFMPMLL